QHWLTIVRPANPVSHTAFLFITGGSNGGKPPKNADLLIASLAAETHSVVAELKMVPNEPLIFHNDGVKRTEDDLIAYTWDQFLKGGDDEWPARLPMVKSAVRAMDCVQTVLADKEYGGFKVDKFVVAGGSKRGWTTWCTAAVDPRVEAIIPLSIDCLNSGPSMRHHVAVYGFYTQSVGDYFNHKITARGNDPRMKLLNDIEDPYSYRDRFTMPKYVVGAAGDQYFCPDNSQFYFDDLPGEKYLRYIPNTDHGLGGCDVRESVVAYYDSILKGTPRPQFTWKFVPDGSIRVHAVTKPIAVKLWQATNPKARDFRMETIGRTFKSRDLKDQGDGVYVAKLVKPEQGWTASFVELSFDVGAPYPLKLTTAVRVTPDTLPFKDLNPLTAPKEAPHHTAKR
ncbi:MAG TPA: PhoPQ-activated protein PqaA family protein, partial [Planctomycetaceae bacterium]|nr:PhoPQ-activated protein PqaA family protein [Planctomycetaceae bacterium]